MADLKTNLLGFVMNSPVIGASGTVGYGVEYEELADFAKIGGISGKGLTLHGQYGNKGERLWETPSGLINSIGLQNPPRRPVLHPACLGCRRSPLPVPTHQRAPLEPGQQHH